MRNPYGFSCEQVTRSISENGDKVQEYVLINCKSLEYDFYVVV